jgi:pyruvate/2-oxoglutarate dehydrogenase complex dihydrolipoamide acyltransferase (E2) component
MVEGDKVVVRPTLRISGTFDHRIVDGFAAGKVARLLRELVEHPEETIREELAQAAE